MVVAAADDMRRILTTAAFALAMIPATALSQEAEGEGPRARKPGTHFVGEIGAGTHVQGAGGFTWGGSFGVGGKPPGTPLRFYLIARAYRTDDSMVQPVNAGRYDYDLKLTDVDFGLRTYFPIARGWRITGEALLGATLADAELREGPDYRTQQNLSMPHITLGIGPQLRFFHELSFGVMARTMFTDTENVPPSGALSVWGGSLGRRTSVVGTLSFHF